MCNVPIGSTKPIVGECKGCGSYIDGEGDSTEICGYSKMECEICGYSPCGLSC